MRTKKLFISMRKCDILVKRLSKYGKDKILVMQLLTVPSSISIICKGTAQDTVTWYPFQQVNAIFCHDINCECTYNELLQNTYYLISVIYKLIMAPSCLIAFEDATENVNWFLLINIFMNTKDILKLNKLYSIFP